MVTHVSYSEERYHTPQSCIAGIRAYVERGWEVCQLRGPQAGPFVVIFRIQDAELPEGAPAPGLAARPS